ncbi:Putative hydrolase C777.06c [Durusdinium trenchii]|uniref:Hydrolase C777.06c n=1 Tax=Durusdinium trenchii TaxID=1381693 RepID=A0ABP0LSX6_9DINO
MLVTVREPKPQHLLVDCGKTFEEAVRRHFRKLGVKGVNAVLLTHGHADAILGLDSLREVQLAREPPDQWVLKAKTPIIASSDTVKEVWSHFHYMLPEGSGSPSLRRRSSLARIVTGLAPHRVKDFQKFLALPGLQVQCLPVLHGGTYVCLGFRFGAKGEFVYLSDVSKVPDDTMKILKSTRAEVLVVDALLKTGPNYSHFGLPQALDLIRELRPQRAYLIGMSCQFDHFHDNQQLFKLQSEGLHVELSYDGLEVEVNLSVDADVKPLDEVPGNQHAAEYPKCAGVTFLSFVVYSPQLPHRTFGFQNGTGPPASSGRKLAELCSMALGDTSPRTPGHYAAGFAIGLNESVYDNVFGSPRGYTDRRCMNIDLEPGRGFHRGARSPSPTTPGTKFERLRSLQELGKPFLDFSLDVVPSRRHSPAPQRHDPRNEIVQALDAYEHTAILGRRVVTPRPSGGYESASPRSRGARSRGPPLEGDESPALADSRPLATRRNKAKDDPKKAMEQRIRRLDKAAAKLEKVAKALVQEAQRQSLKKAA